MLFYAQITEINEETFDSFSTVFHLFFFLHFPFFMARGFISANSARVFALFFCCATREKGNYVEILLPAVTAGGGVAIGADRARTTRRKLSGKHDERNEGEHEQGKSKGVGGGRGAVPLKETQYALLRVTFIFLALSQVQKRRRGRRR